MDITTDRVLRGGGWSAPPQLGHKASASDTTSCKKRTLMEGAVRILEVETGGFSIENLREYINSLGIQWVSATL